MPVASTDKPLVLMLDDDATSARALRQALLRADLAVEVTTYEACRDALARTQPDILLISATLQQGDALKLCAELRELADADSPAMILVAPDGGTLIERSFEAGAADVIVRPVSDEILRRSIFRQVEMARLRRSERELARAQALESALRESEDRYRVLVETFGDIFFNVNPNLDITYLNPMFEKVTGWSRHIWIDQPVLSLVYFDDQPIAMRLFDRLRRGQPQAPVELRFHTQGGDIHYGEFIVQADYQSNLLLGIWGTVRDITKRKLAEAAEREQRELADSLRDTATALNRTLDRDELFSIILTQVARVVPYDSANIMVIDDGLAHIVHSHGYAARGIEKEVEALGFPVMDTPNMRWMFETGQALALPDVREYPGWLDVPATHWVRSYVGVPIRVDGQVLGFVNLDSAEMDNYTPADVERLQLFADQAAIAIRNANLYNAIRRQAEELETRVAERTVEVERERAQLRAILDSMNEGVIYDEKLRVRYINHALTALTGYRIDEWTNYLMPLKSASMSDEEMRAIMDELYDAVEEGREWTSEMRLCRKDGSEFDANITCTQVVDGAGRIIGAVTVIRDISQEKALEAQKARFVAHASHELRTPITNLKTRLYLLQRQPERLADHLVILNDVTDRMRRLVEDLLDVSRFDSGVISLRRQTIELRSLILGVVQMQQPDAERKQIALVEQLPSEPVYIYADLDRLAQVVTNLVVNAINYTPPDGRVEVTVTAAREAITIDVSDTGIGIAGEHLPFLFQPFYRADSSVGGTGLGLSITQQIVELHGGEISVESEPGRGSTFSVRLPFETAQDAAAPGDGHVVRPS